MFKPISRNIALKKLFHHLLIDPMVTYASKIISTATLETNELLECGLEDAQISMRRNGCSLAESYNQELLDKEALRNSASLRTRSQRGSSGFFLGQLFTKKAWTYFWKQLLYLKVTIDLSLAGPVGDEEISPCTETSAHGSQSRAQGPICGPIFGIAKAALLLESDLHILPSRNENFGNVVLEAAALRYPVDYNRPLRCSRSSLPMLRDCSVRRAVVKSSYIRTLS